MFERACVAVIAAISLTGCVGDGARSAAPSAAVKAPADASKTQAAAAPASISPAARSTPRTVSPIATASATPTIPDGARFSIFCESYSSPDHVEFTTNLKNLLVKNTKLHDWYIIHEAGQSSLYHGYYRESDPSAAADKSARLDADRAQRDRVLIESIPNPAAPDRKMFPRSLMVPLDSPDPDAPPAWNLANAGGFWSVQVAAFTGADRKRQTVDAVRQARAMNVPAYYFHGETISSVCVGSWERGAVKEQDVARAGEQGTDRKAREDNEFVVNASGQPLSDQAKNQLGADGKPIRVLESKIEVLDPTLLKTLQDYPAQAVDGYDVPLKGTDANGRLVTGTRPSMIVMIPRDGKTADSAARQSNEPIPTLLNPNVSGQGLGARLRGIGQ